MIKVALKFGAFVAVCLAFTAYLAFTIGNIDLRDPLGRGTYELTASFDDVTGLLPDDNVKVAGVVVGKVTKVRTEAGRAVVTFQVDDDSGPIPKDSSAAIRWRNLIGQRYLYLYPGDSAEALEDGDVIEDTTSVVDLGELFDRLGPIVASIDPAQVNDFLDTITQALDGREDVVGTALDDLATLMTGLASRDDAIQRLITNLDTVADTINARDAQIAVMLENLITLADAFGDNTATLDAALTQLGAFGSEIDAIVREFNGNGGAPLRDRRAARLQLRRDRPAPRQPGPGHRHGGGQAPAARRGAGQPGSGGGGGLPGRQPRRVPQPEDPLLPRRAAAGWAVPHRRPDHRPVVRRRPAPGRRPHVRRGGAHLPPPGGAGAVKSFRDRNPYAVGLVSLLILGALTGAAFMVGLLHLLEDTYEMEGTFTDAAGLRTGDEVKVAGVKVGRVTGIHADREHGLVEVTWVVNRGVDIGEDAGADIALETLLGSKFIRITDPAAGEQLMADLPRDERVIPHEECDAEGVCTPRTTTPVDVFDLTREATERIEETDNDKLNELIDQLTEITDGKRGTVTDLIEGIDQVATAINEREGELADLLDRADELAANLATKDQTLVQLIDSSKTILDFLSQRRTELAAALGEGSDAVRALSTRRRRRSTRWPRWRPTCPR